MQAVNLEQRIRLMEAIKRTEGLLAWAKQHNDQGEISRLQRELDALIALL